MQGLNGGARNLLLGHRGEGVFSEINPEVALFLLALCVQGFFFFSIKGKQKIIGSTEKRVHYPMT